MRRAWKQQILVAMSVGLTVVVSAAAPSIGKQAQFFAGLFYLQSTPILSSVDKREKYHELEALTGITASEAQGLLTVYRTSPAEWRKVYDSIMTLVSPAPTIDKKEAARTLSTKRR